jgi:TetR/AcrR family transcriptional repressor of nem operon
MTVAPPSRVPRGEARARLLDATLKVFREKGFAATSVDDLCAAAGVTKGAFFHHFATKEDIGVAAVEHWATVTGALFAAHPYHTLSDPLDRVFAYLDFRIDLAAGTTSEFSCVAGTVVQEIHASHPAIRAAAAATIRGGAEHVRPHLAEALARHPVPGVSAESLAMLVQAVIQGGIVLGKAEGDPGPLRDAIAHLVRYLRLLFGRPAPA